MSGPAERLQLVAQWVARAEDDLRTAEFTLTMSENCPFGTVCFHGQQAAEKYIKALLVWRRVDFPRVHDIGELAALLPVGVVVPLTGEEQERLTDHAVVGRYPGDREPLSRTEAEEAVALARKVKDAMRAHLP